jgi:hypothetical protein
MHEKQWKIDIVIGEFGDRTRAKARLSDPDVPGLIGIGTARRNPSDADVPEIGDELAVSRALSDLAHRLLEATAQDIEAITHERAYLTS